MKIKIVGLIIMLGLLFGFTDSAHGQSNDNDLYIFGFSQVILNNRYVFSETLPSVNVPTGFRTESYANSFSLHQVNLFFQKPINDKTTFFLNLEASGSYSSKTPSGAFEIPEGWISFKLKENLELKTGLLLPKFNNLNEIKNRLPLMPYIVRPAMYETLMSNIVKPEDYRPENAYIQLYGYNRMNHSLIFDYAFYIGNAENSFLSSIPAGTLGEEEESTTLYQGENLNTQLLFGGRFGIENNYRTFKLGASFTIDEDNKTKIERSIFRLPELTTPVLGEVPRYRLGLDFSFTYKRFVFESEYMGVFHDHSKIHEINVFRNANLNKYFAYTNLTYNISDDHFIFGFSSYHSDNSYEFVAQNSPSKAGVIVYSGGGGWRIDDVTVLKLQFLGSNSSDNDYVDYSLRFITLGLSTIF